MQHRPLSRAGLAIGLGVSTLVGAITVSAVPAVAASSSAKSQKAETSTLTVPLLASSAGVGYEVFAAKQGFYDPYGLSVTTPNSDAGQVKASIVSGQTPLDGLSGTDFLNLVAAGYPVTAIGCSTSAQPFHVYARSSIANAKGLVGKTIGTTSIGSAHEVSGEQFLAKHGVKASQVTFVPLGSVPNILAALESGRIDAGLLSYPFYASAAKLPTLHQLGVSPVPTGLTVVNSGWAKKNKNTILAYLKGTNTGLAAYATDQKAALPVLAGLLSLNLSDPTQAATVLAGYKVYQPPATAPITSCTTAALKPYLPFLTAAEQAKVKNLSKVVDNSYVNTLSSDGFYTQLAKKYGKIASFPS
jgi:ABC-type nitrate/sulfonate/bicarbonate transport system substrate-binding protein